MAHAVVDYVLTHGVLENVRSAGQRLTRGLLELQDRFPFVSEVRGKGLLIALELTHDVAGDLLTACLNERLLVNSPRPNLIRFMPPLVITEAEVDESLEKLGVALEKVGAEKGLL